MEERWMIFFLDFFFPFPPCPFSCPFFFFKKKTRMTFFLVLFFFFYRSALFFL